MPHEPDKDAPRVQPRQRARLNGMWRVGLTVARAARIIKQIESAPARRGDNQERREKRIEMIRMYAGVGQPRRSQSEIAARLGVSRQRVQMALASMGLDRSVRVAPALTPKFLRHFAARMKDHLVSAGYRQCSACGAVKFAKEMSRRYCGRWFALCKPCYANAMREYRATGRYTPTRNKRDS